MERPELGSGASLRYVLQAEAEAWGAERRLKQVGCSGDATWVICYACSGSPLSISGEVRSFFALLNG